MKNLVVFIALVFVSCSGQKENKEEESAQRLAVAEQVNPIIKSIQEAHKLDAFMEEKIISFDINLIFGGNERLDARIYSTTNSSKVLVENAENTQLLFDGNDIWIHPKDSLYEGARFDALTWSYFFMAPFKLNDPGTHHSEPKKLPYQENDSLMTTKMTFGENIGDAPDDWYVVYQNEENQVLEAMAYIVTFGGRDQAKAAQNPHAISYSDYTEVKGIPFAQQWKFWNWSEEEGLQDQLGEAIISNIQFSEDASVFDKKEGSVQVGE